MKLDLGPVRSTYVTPTFGADDTLPLDPTLQKRVRRPMWVGAAIIGVLVFGLGLWASLTPLASGITASGQVTVESNKKTLNHKETATVRQILVKEGQLVHAGQPLLIFDDTDAKANVAILQNQVDTFETNVARLAAESTGRNEVQFPPDVMARAVSDPTVAGMIRDQQYLFTTRLQLFQSQMSVLQQQLDQIQNQIQGDQAQVESVATQSKLTQEQLSSYEKLYAQGFAAKSLILQYERQMADLGGRRGQLQADIARLKQELGETRMKMASMRDQRTSQAAEQLRDSQSKLEESLPKLVAAQEELKSTTVTAPVDGYIFNLTQFTPGAVAGAGQALMDIVPSNSDLTVTVMVKPQDIGNVHVGMPARVRFIGGNPRWQNPVWGHVSVVSADRITNDKTGLSFYKVEIRIDPKDLKDIGRDQKIVPGMNASAQVIAGKRTIMGFLIAPVTDTLSHAMREP